MHQRVDSKHCGGSRRVLLMGLFMWFAAMGGALAQKGIVFTDADLGKEILSAHKYVDGITTLNLTFKHRLGMVGPLEITNPKAGQFDGAYQVSQTFPFTIMPGEAKDVAITLNYGKTIKENTDITLLASPVGAADPKKQIIVKVSLSAEGKLMFWDEKTKRYSSGLGTLVFDGASDKLLEVAWNGSGNGGPCTVAIEGDTRGAFKMVLNAAGAQPMANGSTINITKSAQSFFIKYSGPKSAAADMGKVVIKSPDGKTLTVDLMGTKKGGAAAIANVTPTNPNNQSAGKVGVVGLPTGKDAIKVTTPPAGKDAIKHNTGIPGVNPSPAVTQIQPKPSTPPAVKPDPSATASTPSTPNVKAPAGPGGSYTDPVLAKAHLTSFFNRRRGENIISVGEVTFKKGEDLFETQFKILLDSLDKDPSMFIKPVWVAAISGSDSISIPMTNVVFLEDSMLMRVKLPSEAIGTVTAQDSFMLKVGFMPEYMAGNEPVYLDDQKNFFTGSTIARVYSESYFWLWIWIGIALVVFLFFFLGFLWIRRPISTFRYLRESRYQRERYVGRDEDVHIEIETVHLDLSKRDGDLVQLAFNIHGQTEITGVRDEASGKVRALDAVVTSPVIRGLKRFYVWFFGIFGVSKEPRFRSVYYSLRIEPIKGGIPQNLRVKDESGLLMLGTSLTGNVLATDHQDFRFTSSPFQYKIFFDPSEILDYSGTMKTVTIPFRVTEEPFEGYVMTRDFRLNLEMQVKA